MKGSPGNEIEGRKAYILATVVYEYIATAEPVGSATLTQKYNLGVSAATVRNELAELETEGYLVQPHTSAGRVPSDSGYRTYVDRLMQPEAMGVDERRRICDELRDASQELDEVIEQATKLLGRLSNNVAFITAPQRDSQLFRHIQLIWISSRSGVAIVVTSLGVAAQSLFETAYDVSADDFTHLSNGLNARLANTPLRDISPSVVAQTVAELKLNDDLCAVVMRAFESARSSLQNDVASAGAQNLLDQPEFRDLRKLRSILRIVDEQRTLYDLVADAMTSEGPSVKIGRELALDDLDDLSLVTVPYRSGGGVGMLSILGPRRMPYGRLLALATGTADSLTQRLADINATD